MHLLKFHRIRGPQDSDGHGKGEEGEEEAKEEDGIKRGGPRAVQLGRIITGGRSLVSWWWREEGRVGSSPRAMPTNRQI